MRAELERARREFFGSEQVPYVEAAADAAAQRFAEWFLLERVSDVLGVTPLSGLGDPEGEDAILAESRAGLFLVEAGDGDPQLRDLDGGDSLQLQALPMRLASGDLLVGRLYLGADGVHLASPAIAWLPASPQIAVAFQRDRRRLELGRRLSQAEIERLVFQQWAARDLARQSTVGGEDTPIERIEADLQSLLEAAGADDTWSATSISRSMREAGAGGGALVGALLDQLAFDTDVDLDRARELLLTLWNRIGSTPTERSDPMPGAAPPRAPSAPRRFEERAGEHLGQRLARRIEEGLASHEDRASMFADVERMLGESIDEDEDAREADEVLEDGDLEPLVREFAWEQGLRPAEEALLGSMVSAQRAAPVPRLHVDYLDAEDWSRWLLQVWLAAAPRQRAEAVKDAFALAARFQDWLCSEQSIDVRSTLEPARRVLLEESGRLQEAGDALSLEAAAEADRELTPHLLRVVGRKEDALHLESTVDGSRRWLGCAAAAVDRLVEGDLLIAAVVDHRGRTRLSGPIAVIPAAAEPLLG